MIKETDALAKAEEKVEFARGAISAPHAQIAIAYALIAICKRLNELTNVMIANLSPIGTARLFGAKKLELREE